MGTENIWSIVWSRVRALWSHSETNALHVSPCPMGAERLSTPRKLQGAEQRAEADSTRSSPWKHMHPEKMKWESACSTWSSQSRGAGLGGSGGRELRGGSFCQFVHSAVNGFRRPGDTRERDSGLVLTLDDRLRAASYHRRQQMPQTTPPASRGLS